MINQELFKSFKESPYVQLIKDYFQEQIVKMNEISTHKSWEEVLGKQYAEKIIKDLIRQLENKEPKEKVPNQYK